ncbi:MAG: bifunctional glutamate N-acetyltransferase/amino-acid acetyltransferase ArgJ [Lysobacterales bacterium]
MSEPFHSVEGSITAPRGFRAAGVFCDIKRLGKGAVTGGDGGPKRDLMLIVSDRPAAVAGMFTTNQVCAAPVKVSLRHARKARAQAIVANSGNANACTGEQGMRDAETMVRAAAQALGLPEHDVLVCSTGRIGLAMPMDRVEPGIRAAAEQLSGSREAAAHAAEAIMTSDSVAKEVAVRFRLGGQRVTIGGIAKGAGMIEPGMSATGQRPAAQPLHATMLAFITSDVAIDPRLLKRALREAVAVSFNRITIDGDMSTNDTVLALANGMAENATIRSLDSSDGRRFQQALNRVCLDLARKLVADGEGVTRVVNIRVSGARSQRDADHAARSVGNSVLVKTSWCGGDPNWGRIMDALGYSPARIVEEKVDLGYSAPGSRDITWSLRRGLPTKVTFATLCACVAPVEFDLHIRLNLGQGKAVVYACDLSEAYVGFNKGDVSDPAALGG